MALPINLVFVRHGQSEGNKAKTRSKRGDHSIFSCGDFTERHNSKFRLTDCGCEQAQMAGEWIRANIGPTFDRYCTSEYLRAMETAALLDLPQAKWYLDSYLRERDWGSMDVLSEEERRTKFAADLRRRELDSFYWTPTGGESMATLCLRCDRVLDTLHRSCSDKEGAILVCHGEIIWGMRLRIERIPQARYQELDRSKHPHDRIHNGQILHYTRRDPESGKVAPYVNWFRSVCPTDLSLSSNVWQRIERQTYSNDDLLGLVNQHPRVLP